MDIVDDFVLASFSHISQEVFLGCETHHSFRAPQREASTSEAPSDGPMSFGCSLANSDPQGRVFAENKKHGLGLYTQRLGINL